MHSDQTRSRVLGFSLLETILAFSILVVVLISIYSVVFGGFKRQTLAETQYELTMMARAVLDEYVVTYPEMPREGIYKDMWVWTITEERVEGLRPTSMDAYFEFFEIKAQVGLADAPQGTMQTLSTIVARRGPGL